MFQKFISRPIEIEAFQFSNDLHDKLRIEVVKDDKENPVRVFLPGLEDIETLWNWFTAELTIYSEGDFLGVPKGSWIVKDARIPEKYFVMSHDAFLENFQSPETAQNGIALNFRNFATKLQEIEDKKRATATFCKEHNFGEEVRWLQKQWSIICSIRMEMELVADGRRKAEDAKFIDLL